MKIIEPRVMEVTFHIPEGHNSIEEFIEKAGRTCYKSEENITPESAGEFMAMLYQRGHHSMLEHAVATVRIEADRGFTHELVRHRPASYAQESTRYCNYSKGKFGGEITVVSQPGLTVAQQDVWENAMVASEACYLSLIESGVSPQIARSVLPVAVKSEIVITANLREWHHIFELRTARAAHPIMRTLMRAVLRRFYKKIPSMFGSLYGRVNGRNQ